MPRPDNRLRASLWVMGAAVVGVALWALTDTGSDTSVEQTPRGETRPGLEPRLLESNGASSDASEDETGSLTLQVVDVLTGDGVPDVELRTVSASGGAESSCRTESEGHVRCPGDGPVRVVFDTVGIASIKPGVQYPHPKLGTTVLVIRTVEVRVRVELEDQQPVRESSRARVAAGPVQELGGRGKSLAWLQQNAREYFQAKAPLRASEAKLVVCRGADVVVVGHVPGYLVERATLSASDLERDAPALTLRLHKAPLIRVRVFGPDGKPAKRVLVQHISTRGYDDGSFSKWTELLVSRASGQAFGARSNRRTGLASMHRIEQSATNRDGWAELHPIALEPTRFLRVVGAGWQPIVLGIKHGSRTDDLVVNLKPRVIGPDSYRLNYRGVKVARGTLIIAQEIGGWQIAQAPLVCQQDGSFPAKAIIPGLEYFVMLEGSNVGDVLMGSVTFGTDPDVDVSHLSEEGH